MSKWIRKGDKVVVIAGNDKGRTGEVLLRKADRIIVQGINVRKRHVKKSQAGQNAQILSIERPIHISNAALCDKEGKAIFVSVKKKNGANSELVYKEKDKEVVFRSLKKKKGK
ncbi:MAG: 50S ribosomal protein L24 [Parachlamydiales bacterium]|jgi:large subunit ribosomal protein L24